jgi:hypothetical protein
MPWPIFRAVCVQWQLSLEWARTSYSGHLLSDHLQCAVIPRSYIFDAVKFLLLKPMAKGIMLTRGISTCQLVHRTPKHAILRTYTTYSSFEYNMRHDVYRPRLRVRASQDEELQASRKNTFKQPDDAVLHFTRRIQAIVVSGCATVDRIGLMTCFSRSGRLKWRWIISLLLPSLRWSFSIQVRTRLGPTLLSRLVALSNLRQLRYLHTPGAAPLLNIDCAGCI